MYDTLCLSGGGINGISYLGALNYLQKINYIDITKINNFIGTSAGALICFCIYIGYEIEELSDFTLTFNLSKLTDDINIDNLIEHCGTINGDKVLFMYKSFLIHKNFNENITFLELFKITKKTLSIIVTNYNKCCEENINYLTNPNMPVAIAVRMSSSIPIIFNPVRYNDNWYIDGGLLNNFPIKYGDPKTTLGIHITYPKNNDFNHILDFISGIITIITYQSNHKDVRPDNLNVIKINAYIKNFDLEITSESKEQVFLNGETYAKEYINNLPNRICKQIIDDIINQL